MLPLQEPAARGPVTSANARSRPLQLLVAPSAPAAPAAAPPTAHGEIYWDDGDSNSEYPTFIISSVPRKVAAARGGHGFEVIFFCILV